MKLIVRDNQSDMLKVASLTEQLIVGEKVHFLVEGMVPPHVNQGSATMAQNYKIPHVTGVGPFESWQGIREAITPAWTYTWGYGFAIGTPPPEDDFRYGKQGYLMVPTWFGALGAYADMTNKKVAAFGGDLPQGIGMETFWDPSIQNAAGIGDTTPRSLAERWTKETGEPVSQAIGWSYMSVQVIIDAITRAGSIDRKKVNKALADTDLKSIFGRIVFDKKTQFHRFHVAFGQWRMTDKPWKWEAPIVFSFNEDLPF